MTAVLGIDVGLSSVRAAVVSADGRLLGRGRAEQPPLTGGQHQPERQVGDWQTAIPVAVRAAVEAAGRVPIDAIGLAALGPCPVMLDRDGNALGGVPLFSLDDGAEAERQALIRQYGLTGDQLGLDHVIPRLTVWRRERPADFDRAAMVVDATGYLVRWLCGRAVMDPATRLDHVCDGLAQPLPLPEIVAAASIAGGLTAAASQQLGLPAGTPVCAGTYDSFADLAGAGVHRPGETGILLGSTVVLGTIRSRCDDPSAVTSEGLRVSPHVGDGVFIGGWTSTSGSLIDWSREVLSSPGLEPPHPRRDRSGLLALPYFAGERSPVWNLAARGAIIGLSLSTTSSDLRHAIIEAVVLSNLDIAERLARVAGQTGMIRAAGGGLRNETWAQATADALGCRLEAVEYAGEAMGPAALALRTIGLTYEPRIVREFHCDARRHARYRDLLAIYRRLHPALSEVLSALGDLNEHERQSA